MSNLELYPVQTRDILSIADEVLPILNSFHEHNPRVPTNTVSIFESLFKGEKLLWVGKREEVIEMILVTEFHCQSLFVGIWATKSGWDFNIWYDLIMEKLEQFARYFGCSELRAITRKGLAKKIKQDWDHESCLLFKTI
tara:strand:- start:1277 stop:1693 length:417 start_codon:yes stop_codon:yes gene_type:complete